MKTWTWKRWFYQKLILIYLQHTCTVHSSVLFCSVGCTIDPNCRGGRARMSQTGHQGCGWGAGYWAFLSPQSLSTNAFYILTYCARLSYSIPRNPPCSNTSTRQCSFIYILNIYCNGDKCQTLTQHPHRSTERSRLTKPTRMKCF